MNKVISLSIILAMTSCAGISAMHLSPAEKAVRQPRGRVRMARRIDLADNNQEYGRAVDVHHHIAADMERAQREQAALKRYYDYPAEGVVPFLPRNV